MKLSVVLTVYNGEKTIENCLKSVKGLADEIVVVDNDSTDNTVACAKKYTKNIYSQKNDPQHVDIQKNFGFTKATGEWILSIDADEHVTPELAEEIKKVIKDSSLKLHVKDEIVGYWISRKNIIFGKWIEHTGWYPDEQLRLFKNGKGKYVSSHVHEDLKIDGATGHLTHPLIHENYQTVSQFVQRNLLVYAPNEAESLLEKGYVFSYTDALWFPVREFLSRYFARAGYKDGFYGLVLSLLLAAYHLIIFVYIWEKKEFPQEENVSIRQEAQKIGKELRYWTQSQAIDTAKNPLKKLLLKGKRKLS